MGARGLFSFLHNKDNFKKIAIPVEVRPSPRATPEQEGITILVDGHALWIEVAQRCTDLNTLPGAGPLLAGASFADADVLGGDYWQVSRAFTSLVRTMYERYNVRLIFALDGKRYNHLEGGAGAAATQQADRNREAVRDNRAQKRLKAQMHLYDYCDGAAEEKISRYDSRLPAPPLCFHQIRCALDQLYAETGGKTGEVVYVGGEVDVEVGVLLKRYRANYVLTNDSDFCSMKGISTLMINDMPLKELMRVDGNAVPMEEAVPLSLHYFTSARLCEALTVPGGTRKSSRTITQEELELIASLASNEEVSGADSDSGRNVNKPAEDLSPLNFVSAIKLLQKVLKREPNAEQELKKRKGHPLVVDALRKYRSSVAMKDANGAPVRCSLEERLVAACQSLPPSLHPVLQYGIWHKERLPLFNRQFAYLTDLATFKKLFHVSVALLGKHEIRVYDDQGHRTEPKVCRVDAALAREARDFLVEKSTTAEAQRAFLCKVFCQQVPAAEKTDLFFLSCVLWTMRAGLVDEEELRKIVYTIVLTRALAASEGQSVKSVLSRLLTAVRAARPSSRAMEIGNLFAESFLAAFDIFALVSGGATSSTARALPRPCDVFSGSVLHLVVTSNLTSATRLRNAAEKGAEASKDELEALKAAAETAERLLTPLADGPFLDPSRFPFQPSPLKDTGDGDTRQQNEGNVLRQARGC